MTSLRKTCTECGDEKTFVSFYRHPTCKDGRQSKCKLCVRAMVNANRQLKAEHYNAKQRQRYAADPGWRRKEADRLKAYLKTDRGRESRRITQRIYRAHRKAAGLPTAPSETPEAVRERNRRCYERQRAAQTQYQEAT